MNIINRRSRTKRLRAAINSNDKNNINLVIKKREPIKNIVKLATHTTMNKSVKDRIVSKDSYKRPEKSKLTTNPFHRVYSAKAKTSNR